MFRALLLKYYKITLLRLYLPLLLLLPLLLCDEFYRVLAAAKSSSDEPTPLVPAIGDKRSTKRFQSASTTSCPHACNTAFSSGVKSLTASKLHLRLKHHFFRL